MKIVEGLGAVRKKNHEDREGDAILRQKKYQEYLKSPHWIETRNSMIERAGRKCQLCGYTGWLDVHHNTYERLGEEWVSDLIVLCRGCHTKHHARPAHESYTGLVCPHCGEEVVLRVEVMKCTD
jgi:predicted RNA-binding Zn-ribbon protein involved in translation (DUF1610 family)